MKDNLVNESGGLVNDCISRQAAIDALGEKPLVWDDLSDFDLGKAAQWSDDVDAIKELPSAQPETHEERAETHACDLIDREEATSIPILPKEHRKIFKSIDDAFETGWNEALSCVNMLPSVQPQDIARDIATIIENEKDMRVMLQPQWIPVTERLPDEWKRVLIQNDEGLFLVGFVKDRGWGKEWYYQYEMYDYDAYVESEQGKIVAWCELPNPWKGE